MRVLCILLGASNSKGRGPLIGWDPDIVEALDEDFDLDDPENLLDDDFVLKANQVSDAAQCALYSVGGRRMPCH